MLHLPSFLSDTMIIVPKHSPLIEKLNAEGYSLTDVRPAGITPIKMLILNLIMSGTQTSQQSKLFPALL